MGGGPTRAQIWVAWTDYLAGDPLAGGGGLSAISWTSGDWRIILLHIQAQSIRHPDFDRAARDHVREMDGPDLSGWLTPHHREDLGGRPFGDGTPPGPPPEPERVPASRGAG